MPPGAGITIGAAGITIGAADPQTRRRGAPDPKPDPAADP
jgi:hypothetical protein